MTNGLHCPACGCEADILVNGQCDGCGSEQITELIERLRPE